MTERLTQIDPSCNVYSFVKISPIDWSFVKQAARNGWTRLQAVCWQVNGVDGEMESDPV